MNVYEEVSAFYAAYRGEKRIIGKSVLGRDIFAVKIGAGEPVGVSQYAIHGREWVTALIALEHARRGVYYGSCWLVPLANPDGALLSEVGIASAMKGAEELIKYNDSADFSLWKANAEGVDLNVNFPARWGTGKQNIRTPSPQNYIGSAPFSAPESRILAAFTQEVKAKYAVSWHTKGREIYWEFHTPPARKARDRRLARALSKSTGYPLACAKGSAGGFKDWCIETLKIPAFTVEVGNDSLAHPLGRECLPDLLLETLDALVALSEAMR